MAEKIMIVDDEKAIADLMRFTWKTMAMRCIRFITERTPWTV